MSVTDKVKTLLSIKDKKNIELAEYFVQLEHKDIRK